MGVYWVLTRQRSYSSQILQGADILAKTIGAQVFLPDFIGEGNEFKIGNFPPKTEQEKQQLQIFFAGALSPPTIAVKSDNFAKFLKSEGFKKTGALGYCWGNV